ncbi:bifunctional endo-1,4-beta-xylanase XylA-like [Metopolophium dirhodum]|uniref:bifunctional endo-1,4-beta-xylanase XylA-like n=1 Tax=Metopolophium dirhodum TaxID=44670 RepID=UPI00298F5A46|nr:bifunctional endo-1,4-beta-xylanase XylA-like [Metopolophium dirhodum]
MLTVFPSSIVQGTLRAILLSLPDKSVINAMKVLGAEESRRNKPSTTVNSATKYNNNQNNNNWNQRCNGWNNMPPRNNRWNNQPYRNNDKRGETQQNNTPQTEKIQQVSTNNEEQAGPSGDSNGSSIINTHNEVTANFERYPNDPALVNSSEITSEYLS